MEHSTQVSKIYIATDSNPVDMQSYELCSDMIDVVIDVSCIYGAVLTRLDRTRLQWGGSCVTCNGRLDGRGWQSFNV